MYFFHFVLSESSEWKAARAHPGGEKTNKNKANTPIQITEVFIYLIIVVSFLISTVAHFQSEAYKYAAS